jgi:hypothetical protein
VAAEFEIKERIDNINKKIDYAQEVQNTLRALLTEASAHRMEIIIIALIAVEVIIVLIREGPELFHKLASPLIGFLSDLMSGERPSSLSVDGSKGRLTSASSPVDQEDPRGDWSGSGNTSRRALADKMLDSIHWNTQHSGGSVAGSEEVRMGRREFTNLSGLGEGPVTRYV